MNKRGYIRVSPYGPSEAAQIEALRKAGVEVEPRDDRLFIDRVPARKAATSSLVNRDMLLRILRPDEIVVVSTLDRLGTTREDVIAVLGVIGARGAAVEEAETGERYHWHPDILSVHAALDRAQAALFREHTTPGRLARATSGHIGGRRPRLTGAERENARKDWHDPAMPSQAAVANKYGVSVRTLHNQFGPRFPVDAPKRKAARK
jgi:DNA invertase Pin-like site-specific DNA recombinase